MSIIADNKRNRRRLCVLHKQFVNPNLDDIFNSFLKWCVDHKYEKLEKEIKNIFKKDIVLCLMISVAVISIAWSLSIHVLSGDFYNGFIIAKLVFRERDLTQMGNVERDIWKQDLDRVLNGTYIHEALNQVKADALVMPKLKENEISTKKPKTLKIAHVFQVKNSKVPDTPTISNDGEDEIDDNESTTKLPKAFNLAADRKFLSLMTLDIHKTRWHENVAVKFIYSFPFFSEIIAIVWTAMCFIFQSGVKKTWGLPKPWRIVVPSIITFTIMTVANFSYLLTANGVVKTFCHDLRANLSKPDAISCGDAMSVLRPVIRSQALTHDTYLILFRTSYSLAMILWICALTIMLMRFFLAVDFQLVDVETSYDRELRENKVKEQELSSPKIANSPANLKIKRVQEELKNDIKSANLNIKNERDKSEDDFQSAKSHLSEVATPLLHRLSPIKAETTT